MIGPNFCKLKSINLCVFWALCAYCKCNACHLVRSVDAGRPELQPLPLILRNIGDLDCWKNCEELCILHSSIWSAWNGKEYNFYTDRTRGWFCSIKICDLPQTRRAVFLLHTSARNTKTPCWNFHCWYSITGSLHRKSSKKKVEMSTSSLSKEWKNELKWTSSLGPKLGTGRVLHVKRTVFEDRALGFFFSNKWLTFGLATMFFAYVFGTLPYAVSFIWTKSVDKLAVKRFAMSSNTR